MIEQDIYQHHSIEDINIDQFIGDFDPDVERGVITNYSQADNLDFVHSHARVHCEKQQSTWHGTTMQVVA